MVNTLEYFEGFDITMEELFNQKELVNDPFQDPMGEDAHRGLELFLNKFHQPTVPTHTIITDPEYYVMLWFHNANGNLIHCPYVQMPGSDEAMYKNPLTPDLEFYKINRMFGSENGGIQSGTIYNAGFNRYNGLSVYGKAQESLSLHEKCLDLTPFVREASLPDIQPANAEKIQTLFGETTAGSFSPYASDGQRSITLQVLDTEFSILDAIFYPWMKDINSPWWYKPACAYTEWATPYPMATLEVQRPRMRYRTDYPNFEEQSRNEAKYVYYSYKFIGVKPTSYTAFEVNGAGRNSLLRTLTMVADMCIVDLDEDARGTQDNRANYGRRETLIFNKDWKDPEDVEDTSIPEKTEQEKLQEEQKHLEEVEQAVDTAKKELEQQKVGDQPGWEELEYPDMGRKMKEWSTEFRRDPEAYKKYLAENPEEKEKTKKEEEQKKKEAEEKKKKEEEEQKKKMEEANRIVENLTSKQKQEEEEEKRRKEEEERKKKEAEEKAANEAKKKAWNDYLEKSKKGEVPPPWTSSWDENIDDKTWPEKVFLNGKIYEPNTDGTWNEYGHSYTNQMSIGNHDYIYNKETDTWVEDSGVRGVPTGGAGYNPVSSLSNEEQKRYENWKNSGDVVYAPGENGKMVKGQNGVWTEVPDSEVPKEWKKDKTGKWVNSDPNASKPWNTTQYNNAKPPQKDDLDDILNDLEGTSQTNGQKQTQPQPATPPASNTTQNNSNSNSNNTQNNNSNQNSSILDNDPDWRDDPEIQKWVQEIKNSEKQNSAGNKRGVMDMDVAMAGGMAREIQAVMSRYDDSQQVFLQDSEQTFVGYRETIEESVSRNGTMFLVHPDLDYPDFHTSIVCGFLNDCMKESFPAVWNTINLAQNHLADENRNMSGVGGPSGKQMKDYIKQVQKCTDGITLATSEIKQLNEASQDILQNMEFVGKVVASVFKASQVVGDQSAFVGEFGGLISRMMDESGFNPSPIRTYVEIVSGEKPEEE